MTRHADNLMLDLEEQREDDPVLDFEHLFGNGNDVEVELGIGKGRFLIDAAQRHVDRNYFGVEWASKYLRIAHQRCLKRRLSNVRLARADAREFVEFFLPAGSIRAYHIYFPDPWPKKRHHKRRLVNREFIAEIERSLTTGGRLWIATDHVEYFEVMLEVLKAFPQLREVEAEWEGVPTNYEEKYLARGVGINRKVVELA